MTSISLNDLILALFGSSMFVAYCIWLLSIIYTSYFKLNGSYIKLLRLIMKVIFFIKIIQNAYKFMQNSNIFNRECNKFTNIFNNQDYTGFLDAFHMNTSFYWLVFLKWLILESINSPVMLAVSAEIIGLKFKLLKKWIDRQTVSRENVHDVIAVIFFTSCFELTDTHGNHKIGAFLFKINLIFIFDLFRFITNKLTSRLFDLSMSIQLKKHYGKQFKVLIITLLFFSFFFAIQYRVLAGINDTFFYWPIAILNLMKIFEMIKNLTIYAFLVIENLKDYDLDESIYYIKAFASVIDFFLIIILYVFGIYNQYLNPDIVRASFLLILSYFLFVRVEEGWSTLIKLKDVNLKISNMTLFKDENSENKEFSCPICYGSLALAEARITHCRHTFHAGCIKKWIYLNSKCPMCRKNI